MLDPSHKIWHVDLRRVDVLGDTPLEIDVTANRLTKPTDSHKCSIIKEITYSSFHVKQEESDCIPWPFQQRYTVCFYPEKWARGGAWS